MTILLRLSAIALVLVILPAIPAMRPALAEDERPDLKVELVGLPLTGTQREVQLKITNVGAWWADETRLQVVPTPSAAGNALDQVVENLDPGQSVTVRYMLSSACAGGEVKVRAEVSAGRNYEGVPESGDLLKNNVAEGVACAAQAVPFDTRDVGVFRRPPGDVVLLPEHLQPGKDKFLSLNPSVATLAYARHREGSCYFDTDYLPGTLMVGFDRDDSTFCQRNEVFRTMLKFDLSDFAMIYGVQKLLIGSATLFWEDTPVMSNFGGHLSCVVELVVPTEDWGAAPDRFVHTEYYASDDDGSIQYYAGSFQVQATRLVLSWLGDPVAANRGVVLRGPDESLDAGDSTDCVSRPRNIKLQITYTVLP